MEFRLRKKWTWKSFSYRFKNIFYVLKHTIISLNKEIIILAYIKSLKENLEAYGITEEQYEQLETFFGLKQLEETIEANKNKQREEILKRFS